MVLAPVAGDAVQQDEPGIDLELVQNDFAEDAIEPLIVEKAKDYREDNPGLGCAKLYLIIKQLFEETGCMPGRDAFIEILRKHGLMVHLRRRKRYRTTDSVCFDRNLSINIDTIRL